MSLAPDGALFVAQRRDVLMRRLLLALALGASLTIGLVGGASAKIEPVDIACANPAGQYPGGQQPSCEGEALTQESENQNPAGHAPGGHNK